MQATRWMGSLAIALFAGACSSELAEGAAVSSAPLGQQADPESKARTQAGWNALVDWDAQPTLTRESVRMFSSSERENSGVWFPFDAGNKDFNNFLAVCGARPALTYQYVDNSVSCAPGEEGYLLAAVDGPGYVSRIGLGGATLDLSGRQIDSGLPIQPHPTDELIKIYVDDAIEPVFVGRWSDWDTGAAPPFSAPLTGWSSGLVMTYVPISFQRRLRVFADKLNPVLYTYYHQITVHSGVTGAAFDAAALSGSEAQAELATLMERAQTASGAENWLDTTVRLDAEQPQTVWERDQPGTIERLTITLPAAEAERALSEISLRVHWDDAPEAAIELTLAELFGARQGIAEFQTLPMQVRRVQDSLELRLSLPMPFAEHARLVLASTAASNGLQLQVRVDGKNAQPQAPWGHLHTLRKARTRPNVGDRFDLAELDGPGKYVGTLLYMTGGPNPQNLIPGPMPLNFLEGDERMELDGITSQGTGTEETFNAGWYFSDGRFDSTFSASLHIDHDHPEQGAVSAVRWYLLSDSLPFQQHFQLDYEYGSNAPVTAFEYVAVGFYYQ